MSRDLPQFPNLEHLRKQAKALHRELQKKDPRSKLADAQLTIARRYGFASWNKLKTHIESLPVAESSGPGLFVRFTQKSRRMVFFARYWAARLGSETIDPEHLVRGLLEEESDFVRRFTGDSSAFESTIREFRQHTATPDEVFGRQPIPLSEESKRVIQLAADEAERLGHENIAIGHFWLALLGSSLAGVLKETGTSLEQARVRIVDMIREELL